MSQVATYLNFERETEEAFAFYKSVFGTEYMGEVMRMGDVPEDDEGFSMDEENKDLIMNIALPIMDGHILMGTDVAGMGFPLVKGNNAHIVLMPETRVEADRLFAELSAGGQVQMEMQDTFWGDYYGSFADKFGVGWMINCNEKKD